MSVFLRSTRQLYI